VYSFWNVDYVERTKVYPVQATNTLEATFLALLRYELFVAESTYDEFFKKVQS